MKGTIIRKIEKLDNEALLKIIRAVFEEHDAPKEGTVYSDPTTADLYALFSKESAVLWVAEVDGVVVGCCGIYPTDGLPAGCAELVKFYLDPTARGLGIGKALMKKSIESAKSLRYDKIYLESFPEFSKAVKMYRNLGFRLLENPLGNSGHHACSIWMLRSEEPTKIKAL
ncbi:MULTISPECIES: GNAT family N-acetyltransferase [unclassified Chryseobacterium]|uniref:GNAT family N-acetyltransferase n=1 Tax=unclassified Chryseobacterium TaxID=2593645 RepID=UPI00115A68C9|nr:GNAT family N-acetyltransferase [Chryseobacterium sp. ON_d1]GEJ45965.1 N-acetyltransferase [Chryseobacterium sp. ON_d1]